MANRVDTDQTAKIEIDEQQVSFIDFIQAASSEFGTYRLCEQRIHAVSPEPSLLAHTSSESRGTFRQKVTLQILNFIAIS